MKIKTLISGMFVYGGINILQKTISVLLVPIYLRALPQSEFGALDILVSTNAFIFLIFMLQIESGVGRFFYQAERDNKINIFISSHLWLLGISLGFGGILLLSSSSIILIHFIPSTRGGIWLILIMSLTLIPRGWTAVLLLILRFKNWKVKFGVAALLNTLLTSTVAVVLVVVAKMGVMGVLLGQLAGSSLTCLYLLTVLRSDIIFKFSYSILKESMHYSLFLIPGMFFGWAQSYLNRFLMRLSGFELESIAIYALAFKFSIIITLSISALKMIWQPEAMKAIGQKGSKNFYARVYHTYVMGMLLIGGLITILAKPLIHLIAPPSYLPAATLVPFIISATIISCTVIFRNLGILISKKTIWNSISVFFGALTNALVLLLGIRSYGMWAVIAGYIAGIIVTTGMTFFISQSLYRIPYQKVTSLSLIVGSILFCLYPFFDNWGLQRWGTISFIVLTLILSYLSADRNDLKKIYRFAINRLNSIRLNSRSI